MQAVYGLRNDYLQKLSSDVTDGLLDQAVWIDLLDPTAEEEAGMEAELGSSIPTRADMMEVKDSARLFEDRGAAVMTAVMVEGTAEGPGVPVPITEHSNPPE